ncbi:phage integrase SAM-like domain-containing protein [Chryseobacterium cucumeris]|uniref:phage integrase SAM-like domain-containing protein n=1 Tax=Chryseobacterium cucumeris TaxID=1813611 RepID=UPI0007EF9923|nr:phage integrase SAM-like domain-containing protein [Chryseobacterium cucumeris]
MTLNFFLPQNHPLALTSTEFVNQNIYLSIIDKKKGIKYTFKTPFTINTPDWDILKQRPINIYLKKYKKINANLNNLKIQITKILEDRILHKKSLSQRIISKDIKRICSKQDENSLPENSLLYFINLYISLKKDIISHSTYKRYMVFYKHIERFEGYIMKRMHIENIGMEFIKEFIVFSKSEEYSESTIYRTIHFVKTILNFAEKKGIITQVRIMEVRREKQYKEVVTLSEQEILLIKKTPVPKELQAAKDWLLISCFTGQRISDFMRFSDNQLLLINGKTCISFIQQKTGKKIIIPLHPTVLNIITCNGCFPQAIPIAQYNQQIKKIAQITGLNEKIYSSRRSAHRAKKMFLEKWEVITSHIGRRSFATNFYGKIPTPLLMEATGHSTEQMFKKYVNPLDHNRIASLGRYFDKIHRREMIINEKEEREDSKRKSNSKSRLAKIGLKPI